MLYWQFIPANRARVVIFEPRSEAIRVEHMPTRHENSPCTDRELIDTYWASRMLELTALLFTVLLLYLDNWEFIDGVLVCRLFLLLFILELHISEDITKRCT